MPESGHSSSAQEAPVGRLSLLLASSEAPRATDKESHLDLPHIGIDSRSQSSVSKQSRDLKVCGQQPASRRSVDPCERHFEERRMMVMRVSYVYI